MTDRERKRDRQRKRDRGRETVYLSIYFQGQDGATPLRCAVQEGQAGVVAVLLANGGPVEELVSYVLHTYT